MVFENATVVGAGTLGSGIAQSLAAAGLPVRLHDIDQGRLDRAMEWIEHGRYGLRRGEELGKLAAGAATEAVSRLLPTTDLATACADPDVVVEAVTEDLGLKITVFRQLEALCPAHTVLTSNTGGFPITALAYATDRPRRVLGWHWSQPVSVMPFAEIIVLEDTDPEAVEAVSETARVCGKNPIVVKDQPLFYGFVVNRLNNVLRHEAARIVAEGVATEEQIDALMRDCLHWPMGPFEMQEQARDGFAHA